MLFDTTPSAFEGYPMITETTSGERLAPPRLSRWQIAAVAGVVLLAAGIGVVLGVNLTGGRGAGLGVSAGYVPASAPIYVEARLDLPGEQRDNLRSLIERFPGTDADAVLTDALATALDDALSGSGFTYSGDVAPWFDGGAAMALLDYPSMTDPAAGPPSVVFLLGVRDPVLAESATDRVRAAAEAQGATFTSTDVRGTKVWSADAAALDAPMAGNASLAYALTDDQLVLGSSTDAVTTALNVHAGDGSALADRSEVRDLGGHLPAEVAGLMTMNLEATLADLRASLGQQDASVGAAYDQLLAGMPTFVMASVSFEADAARFDTVSQVPSGGSTAANSARDLADQVPADAIAFADAGNVGDRLSSMIGALRSALTASGADAGTLDQVQAALGGDPEQFVSWIGDAAVTAGFDGSQPYAGMVLAATDADAARQRMGQLRALVGLAALDPSSGVSVSTDTVAGAEVTTVSFDASGGAAADAPMQLSTVQLQWAVDDTRVVIGFGDRFVGRVLGLDPADSLGASARFGAALDRLGGDNTGVVFVDLGGLRDSIATMLPAEMRAQYDAMAPMLAPLDYMASVSSRDGDVSVQRTAIVLK
jgi:Protein of unknown function (DUF3352)